MLLNCTLNDSDGKFYVMYFFTTIKKSLIPTLDSNAFTTNDSLKAVDDEKEIRALCLRTEINFISDLNKEQKRNLWSQ